MGLKPPPSPVAMSELNGPDDSFPVDVVRRNVPVDQPYLQATPATQH